MLIDWADRAAVGWTAIDEFLVAAADGVEQPLEVGDCEVRLTGPNV